MLEEPCIIQMTIDRYHAMLRGHLAGRERARIEQLLAEANNQLAEAIRQLARAIDLDQRDAAAGQVLSYDVSGEIAPRGGNSCKCDTRGAIVLRLDRYQKGQ